MSYVNKVILIGNVGRDPETRYTADGAAVVNASVATTRYYKDSGGNKQEETEWHRVVFFGRIAEIANEYLRKGSKAYIEGRLRTRKWADKSGGEKYATEIVAESLQLLGRPSKQDDVRRGGATERGDGVAVKDNGTVGEMADDTPF